MNWEIPTCGTCQCGSIRYKVTMKPFVVYACHCHECQKLSTSAFSITMLLSSDGFELLSGKLKSFERESESGATTICWLCPECGNRIYHGSTGTPGIIRVKPSTLENANDFAPQVHLWTCREQSWLKRFDEIPKIEQQPDLKQAMAAISKGDSPF